MGEPIQITRDELNKMLQEATANAVRARERAMVKKKLCEHVSADVL